ncbi:hypothetical protein L798_14377 [Zootermopsis nevadensis]|uniref:Uncharacterized protein n=1 Tax=Zootermopsis nevadensis TaxID=136037 RepID=A0A067QMM7_ZOONE|nr:hypothetical protein L798_14377 [Zootermopsis nevadensis]
MLSVMWQKEHLWSVCILQRVHLSSYVKRIGMLHASAVTKHVLICYSAAALGFQVRYYSQTSTVQGEYESVC